MTTDPLLTINIVTYNHMPFKLLACLYSLLCQVEDNWIADVYHDGPADKETKNFMFNLLDFEYPIEFMWTNERSNKYGHDMRQKSLDRCKTKYIHFMNGDNLFFPTFSKETVNILESTGKDMVIFPIVHNYARGNYQVLDPQPSINNIDVSSFVVKTEIAKQVNWSYDFAADGKFVEDLIKLGISWIKIPQILLCHN